jgi:hypothetical protein
LNELSFQNLAATTRTERWHVTCREIKLTKKPIVKPWSIIRINYYIIGPLVVSRLTFNVVELVVADLADIQLGRVVDVLGDVAYWVARRRLDFGSFLENDFVGDLPVGVEYFGCASDLEWIGKIENGDSFMDKDFFADK